MNTIGKPQAAREAKQRLVSAGRGMRQLLENESFIYLLESVDTHISQVKAEALASKSYDELLEKRGILQGLSLLRLDVDSVIARGKSAENTLKK